VNYKRKKKESIFIKHRVCFTKQCSVTRVVSTEIKFLMAT